MSHIVHSFWTKPMIRNRRDINFIKGIELNTFSFACSAAWVIASGGKVNLYADGFATDLLDFIPYDNIYKLTVPAHIPVCSWACGKFFALEQMPLGDVHIDGDVYLKDSKLIESVLDGTDYDCVVQSIEDDREVLLKYYDSARKVMMDYKISTAQCSLKYSPSYNCGTVGFFNQELKDKYLVEYFTTLNNIIHSSGCVKAFNDDPMAVPDLIMEQQFLYELAKPYRVHNLLGNSDTMYQTAVDIHYQHVLGRFKEQQINQIKTELAYVNPDLYKKAVKAVSYLY